MLAIDARWSEHPQSVAGEAPKAQASVEWAKRSVPTSARSRVAATLHGMLPGERGHGAFRAFAHPT